MTEKQIALRAAIVAADSEDLAALLRVKPIKALSAQARAAEEIAPYVA